MTNCAKVDAIQFQINQTLQNKKIHRRQIKEHKKLIKETEKDIQNDNSYLRLQRRRLKKAIDGRE